MSSKYDVLVVGGGPAGSRAGGQVAGKGFNTIILEKRQSFSPPICCTGLISQECLDRFAIDHNLVLRCFRGARVFSPAGTMLAINRPAIQAYAVDRPELDAFFMTRAVNRGAEYRQGVEVTALDIEAGGVVAKVAGPAGEARIEARMAVLAAGFNSHLLAPNRIKPGPDRAVGIQAKVETRDVSDIEIYTGSKFAPGFFAWLVPVSENRALAGLIVKKHARKHFDNFLTYLKSVGKAVNSDRPRLRGLTLGSPSRTFDDRLMVIGDGAGQVKPITGGGLYYGLMCADIAADCLAGALRRDMLGAASLAGYESAWHHLLQKELRVARLARRAFGLLNDTQLDRVFNYVIRHRLADRLAKSKTIGFDWHGQAISRSVGLLIPLACERSMYE